MSAPLSNDIRERVVRYRQEYGATYEYIAEALGIGRASVSRVLRLHREKGSVDPKPATGGVKPRLDDEAAALLISMLKDAPDMTLDQLADAWNAAHPELPCSRQTIGRVVRAQGYTRKKSRCGPRSRTATKSSKSAPTSRSG